MIDNPTTKDIVTNNLNAENFISPSFVRGHVCLFSELKADLTP